MAEHGELRHRGLKTEVADNGLSAFTYSDTETYCAHCRRWVPTPGVTGALAFMARHRDGDCAKAQGYSEAADGFSDSDAEVGDWRIALGVDG